MATLDVIGNLSLHNTSGYEGDFSSYVELVRDEKRDVVTLSEREQKVLDLSDRLQELELEGSLLKAHQVVPPVTVGESLNNDDIDEQCRLAGVDLLKAKATYNLRNQVIENVLMSDPILQAVHSGTNATSVERALLPLINRRDVLSMAHTDLSSSLNSTLTSLSKTQRDNVIAVKINRELTGTLLNLAAEAEVKVIQDDIDPKLRDQLDNLEEQIEMQRSKWRVMKKVVSAIVVGSGIDWARNDEFRELVMDDENGDGP